MILITNFKTYESALWESWVDLAKIHKKISEETWKKINVAWNALDLRMLLESWASVYAQWADLAEYWSFTWKILPIKLKKIWCKWVILNHSENRIEDKNHLWKIISRCNELWLETIVCIENIEEWVELLKFNPVFLAIEPPELIWWNISVSKANPEIIVSAVEKLWKWKVIVWAWIKTSEDIQIAKKLWASWILLASWITKAENPEKVLRELALAL